ncbi:MAG: hypothetical protein M3203_16150, partial [Actinomycetota bacterium]|nr:hypothetical protein [Actinomycetota bacterium]
MWRKPRTGAIAATAVLVLLVLAARPVLAAAELGLSPPGGPPGSPFTVTGTGFALEVVEIHWGSQDGPLLATAVGPEFTVEATVPDDAPAGSHAVVAVAGDGTAVSTSNFQVTSGEPVEPTEPTTTTVAATPGPSPTTTPTTTPAASGPVSGGAGLSRASALGGGVDGGMADTTNGSGGESGGDRALGAPAAAGASG